MEKRNLGELEVSALGLGCMGMSEFYGKIDEKEAANTLHTAIDNGINFLDTANVYGNGHNEEFIGKVLKDRRNEFMIATKFGFVRDPEKGVGISAKPDDVRSEVEKSLRRLRMNTIDLYYLHRVDPTIPIEETVGVMSDLVREGKVRYLGLSEVSASTLKRAIKVHPISALQTEYSLWSRDLESIIPVARVLGVGIVPYSPLGRGFLSGKVKSIDDLAPDDYRRHLPRFQGENFKRNVDLVNKLEEIAKEKGVKASQLALAWLLQQGDDIIPIPGTKHVNYLLENIEALNITLSGDELLQIDKVSSQILGNRYGELSMKYTNM
ncbi:aldo/keto reductase [Bacillus sp. RG28]|uniref:Aldo/keto reductase n=1 Tax=Gottfriedia endophytica TaxID=2820819 RepID=A0A940SHN5_9BACI|nr:aldo/keto reductase [Gottfriedia endophytica]MBP0726377.1 aldo/keto reductase [Gottfriedia endophytica]